jgi:hypothetical protein
MAILGRNTPKRTSLYAIAVSIALSLVIVGFPHQITAQLPSNPQCTGSSQLPTLPLLSNRSITPPALANIGGTTYMVYENTLHGHLFVTSSSNNGSTWARPVDTGYVVTNFSSSGTNYPGYVTATNFNGQLYIVYSGLNSANQPALFSTSSSNGTSFSPPQNLSIQYSYNIEAYVYPISLTAFNGRLYIPLGAPDGSIVVVSSTDGQTFGNPIAVAPVGANGENTVGTAGTSITTYTPQNGQPELLIAYLKEVDVTINGHTYLVYQLVIASSQNGSNWTVTDVPSAVYETTPVFATFQSPGNSSPALYVLGRYDNYPLSLDMNMYATGTYDGINFSTPSDTGCGTAVSAITSSDGSTLITAGLLNGGSGDYNGTIFINLGYR